jgi:hypothetical protein
MAAALADPGEALAGVLLTAWLLGVHVCLELLRLRLSPLPGLGAEAAFCSALGAISATVALLGSGKI